MYIVARQSTSAAEVRQWVSERLPAAFVPHLVIPLDDLPLTEHGKVDRSQLPSPWQRKLGPEHSIVAPVGRQETVVADALSHVLHIPKISRHDNFFDLGGDSISAIQIIAKLREINLELTPVQLFESQTVAEIATRLTPLTATPSSVPADKPFAAIKDGQREKLARILKSRKQQP